MRPRLWSRARAALERLVAALVDRFTQAPAGLISEEDEAWFAEVAAMPSHLALDDEPELPLLIFDALVAEWPDLLAARDRAMRTPTMEIRIVFEEMTAGLDIEWGCDSCRGLKELERPHASCRGCACPCRTPALVGAANA